MCISGLTMRLSSTEQISLYHFLMDQKFMLFWVVGGPENLKLDDVKLYIFEV